MLILHNNDSVTDLEAESPIPWYFIQIYLTVIVWIMIIGLIMFYTMRLHIVPAVLGSFIFGVIFLAVPSLW